MSRTYQLPRKPAPCVAAVKPIKGVPDSDFFTIIKSAAGTFQVVNRSALDGSRIVVAYTAAKKDWAIDWILLNDGQGEYNGRL